MWMLCRNNYVEKKRDFFRGHLRMRYALPDGFQSYQIGKSGNVTEDVEERLVMDCSWKTSTQFNGSLWIFMYSFSRIPSGFICNLPEGIF